MLGIEAGVVAWEGDDSDDHDRGRFGLLRVDLLVAGVDGDGCGCYAAAHDLRRAAHVAAGVAAGDGIVGGVVVAGHLGGVGGFEHGVDADEPAGGGVVLARAEVFQGGGGVGSATDVALVAGPGGGCRASGLAEGVVLAAGDGLREAGIDREGVGALPVGDQVLHVTGTGALGDRDSADAVVAGGGQRQAGGVLHDLFVADEQGGGTGVRAQDQVAAGAVQVGAAAGDRGVRGEVSLVVPLQRLLAGGATADRQGVAVSVVRVARGVRGGGGPGGGGAGQGVGLVRTRPGRRVVVGGGRVVGGVAGGVVVRLGGTVAIGGVGPGLPVRAGPADGAAAARGRGCGAVVGGGPGLGQLLLAVVLKALGAGGGAAVLGVGGGQEQARPLGGGTGGAAPVVGGVVDDGAAGGVAGLGVGDGHRLRVVGQREVYPVAGGPHGVLRRVAVVVVTHGRDIVPDGTADTGGLSVGVVPVVDDLRGQATGGGVLLAQESTDRVVGVRGDVARAGGQGRLVSRQVRQRRLGGCHLPERVVELDGVGLGGAGGTHLVGGRRGGVPLPDRVVGPGADLVGSGLGRGTGGVVGGGLASVQVVGVAGLLAACVGVRQQLSGVVVDARAGAGVGVGGGGLLAEEVVGPGPVVSGGVGLAGLLAGRSVGVLGVGVVRGRVVDRVRGDPGLVLVEVRGLAAAIGDHALRDAAGRRNGRGDVAALVEGLRVPGRRGRRVGRRHGLAAGAVVGVAGCRGDVTVLGLHQGPVGDTGVVVRGRAGGLPPVGVVDGVGDVPPSVLRGRLRLAHPQERVVERLGGAVGGVVVVQGQRGLRGGGGVRDRVRVFDSRRGDAGFELRRRAPERVVLARGHVPRRVGHLQGQAAQRVEGGRGGVTQRVGRDHTGGLGPGGGRIGGGALAAVRVGAGQHAPVLVHGLGRHRGVGGRGAGVTGGLLRHGDVAHGGGGAQDGGAVVVGAGIRDRVRRQCGAGGAGHRDGGHLGGQVQDPRGGVARVGGGGAQGVVGGHVAQVVDLAHTAVRVVGVLGLSLPGAARRQRGVDLAVPGAGQERLQAGQTGQGLSGGGRAAPGIVDGVGDHRARRRWGASVVDERLVGHALELVRVRDRGVPARVGDRGRAGRAIGQRVAVHTAEVGIRRQRDRVRCVAGGHVHALVSAPVVPGPLGAGGQRIVVVVPGRGAHGGVGGGHGVVDPAARRVLLADGGDDVLVEPVLDRRASVAVRCPVVRVAQRGVLARI